MVQFDWKFIFLLVLLLLRAQAEEKDTFIITGEMRCEYPPFRFTMKIYEDDICWDDLLSYSNPRTSETYVRAYTMNATDTKDDLYQTEYELVMIIFHNCYDRSSGKTEDLRYRVPLGTFRSNDSIHRTRWSGNITDAETRRPSDWWCDNSADVEYLEDD